MSAYKQGRTLPCFGVCVAFIRETLVAPGSASQSTAASEREKGEQDNSRDASVHGDFAKARSVVVAAIERVGVAQAARLAVLESEDRGPRGVCEERDGLW